MEALQKAISLSGGQNQLAGVLGVVQSAVAGWLKRGSVPEKHCPAIELATVGSVTVEQLHPAEAWRRVPDPDWPHPLGRPVLDYAALPELDESDGEQPAALAHQAQVAINSEAKEAAHA